MTFKELIERQSKTMETHGKKLIKNRTWHTCKMACLSKVWLTNIVSFKRLLPPNIYEMFLDHMGKVSTSIIQKLSSIEFWHNTTILSPTTTSSTISSPPIPIFHFCICSCKICFAWSRWTCFSLVKHQGWMWLNCSHSNSTSQSSHLGQWHERFQNSNNLESLSTKQINQTWCLLQLPCII